VPQSVGDHIDGARDLRKRTADGRRDGRVLVIDEPYDFERRHLVEIRRGAENLFGGELSEIRLLGPGWGQCRMPFKG
jgi:hypothetical protein